MSRFFEEIDLRLQVFHRLLGVSTLPSETHERMRLDEGGMHASKSRRASDANVPRIISNCFFFP